jgi:hypothetical protein
VGIKFCRSSSVPRGTRPFATRPNLPCRTCPSRVYPHAYIEEYIRKSYLYATCIRGGLIACIVEEEASTPEVTDDEFAEFRDFDFTQIDDDDLLFDDSGTLSLACS